MKGFSLEFNDKNFLMRICMVLLLSFALVIPITTTAAPATGGSDSSNITQTLCNAVNQLTGTIGRSIAILIVISLAIALFLGKVSWGIAIAVGVGMGILFGARDVVDILSGGTTCEG